MYDHTCGDYYELLPRTISKDLPYCLGLENISVLTRY